MTETGEAAVGSKIAIIGTGYVGLTTGACLAHLGHTVVCADVVQAKVDSLSKGEVPILEAGLDELVAEGIAAGRLSFVMGAKNAVTEAEFVYLCLPTPQGADGAADLSYIQSAAAEIGPHVLADAVVINKSTVPVGSVGEVEKALGRPDVHVVSNPEFLREGTAVQDFLHPDRVVIGGRDEGAAKRVGDLYAKLEAPTLVTDPASAETIKYASNAFLATKISFVNAIAAVCEAVGADVADVVEGMGFDTRIGSAFLNPGPGWGGSCFPKDSHALVRIAENAGYTFGLLRAVVAVNEEQFGRVANKVSRLAGGSLEGKTVAVWGVTFKALTDDLRDSPALNIIARLREQGATIRAYDPSDQDPSDARLAGIELVADPLEAATGADVLAVLTEWPEFAEVDLGRLAEVIGAKNVVDARNLLDRDDLKARGFTYEGIGRS
ncbi:UDP-glucose/GDP-mannose dehydrogenase family protein [Aquihabitans sp. G128]|uniref:UDP-glucose dehydrogenase family protein n=1 Tax=Aquihabitans sp. G128 TaxID=2849779 RepID=UPI001C212806|nr:UDP-glucose/GDP-mannose dehydrogenase family protein [Aquihabitans sp. G128]QXC61429.1 UDP-glucose/GDP-mannose dehydrogenase family protein [Aquihabitans sp. G128]